MEKLLKLIQTLDNLSRIPRTGGTLFAGIDPSRSDSIAEHSYKVSYLALLLGKIALKNGVHIDTAKVVEKAIVHDWSECVLMDVPSGSPSYRSYFDENYPEMVKSGAKNAIHAIEAYVQDIVDIEISDDDLSPEERTLLSICDITALHIEILEWKYQGLQYEWLDFMWSNTLSRLKEKVDQQYEFLQPLVAELDQAFITGVKPANPFLTLVQFQTRKKHS
jgi:5'-deoxynucleotidase YfbR-like HD superfamily hydrolase